VGVSLFLVEVVAVIGGHQLDPQFTAQGDQALVDLLLLEQAVFLDFKIESVSEDLLKFTSLLPGTVHIAAADEKGYMAVQAGGQGDDVVLIAAQGLHVDSRFVVKPLELGNTGHFMRLR
jgi:hypothetical protein